METGLEGWFFWVYIVKILGGILGVNVSNEVRILGGFSEVLGVKKKGFI